MKTRNLKIFGAIALASGLIVRAQSADITTTDGKTYRNVSLVRTEPDGLVIQYQPERPGIGMAKLNFRILPESLRSRYGYDPTKAATFEADTAQSAAERRQQLSKSDSLRLYRDFAELHRSVVGDNSWSTYTITIDPDGRVSVQDQSQLYPYSLWQTGVPWTTGLATDTGYAPVGAMPYGGLTPYGTRPYNPLAPYNVPTMLRPNGY